MGAVTQKLVAEVLIKDGKAYLPFNLSELRWLLGIIPRNDIYAEVVKVVIEKMEQVDGERS